MMTNYEHTKEWRKRTKKRAIESFGGKCAICGYDKCEEAFDFHHLNSKEKEFCISSRIKSWDKVVVELRKCILLCCRCHQELHFGKTQIPVNAKRFDENFVVYNHGKIKLKDFCPICGKEKWVKQKTCSNICSGKIRQKIDWSEINLIDMIENKKMSYIQIGEKLNITDNAVRKRYFKLKGRKIYKIKSRKRD